MSSHPSVSAVRNADIAQHSTCYAPRHSFAIHLLRDIYDEMTFCTGYIF